MSKLHLLIHSALQQIWREHPLGASELCAGETKVAWQPSLEDLPCGGRGRCVGAEPPHCIVSAGDTGTEQAEQGGQKLAPGKPHSGGRKQKPSRRRQGNMVRELHGSQRTESNPLLLFAGLGKHVNGPWLTACHPSFHPLSLSCGARGLILACVPIPAIQPNSVHTLPLPTMSLMSPQAQSAHVSHAPPFKRAH